MTDSNITSRLRKLRFGRRLSPTRSVPTTSKASSVSSQKSKTQLAKIDIYRPLSPSTREIRLLRILPEQPGSLLLGPDPISCVLSHVSLDDKPTYHALSYTWDDESLGQSFEDPDDVKRKKKVLISGFIFLDGQAVEVTPNLWVALWHLRRSANWFKQHPDAEVGEFGERMDRENQTHFTYETPIWIDALCINQLDVLERNEQVQMMGLLYRNAQSVHAWTGLEIPEIGLLAKMVRDFSDNFGTSDAAPAEVHRMLRENYLQTSWAPLPLLCKRPYWERVWIAQEYLLARQALIHVGLRVIDVSQFTFFAHAKAESLAAISMSEWTPIDRETSHCRIIHFKHASFSRPRLGEVLIRFTKQKCSDPRDKIYGILGISEKTDYGIEVDYTLDADTVYQQAIRQIILKDQDLELIFNPHRYSCECTKSQHSQSSLPSWVPDLRCLNSAPTIGMLNFSWHPTGTKSPSISATSNRKVISCRGLLLGSIAKININLQHNDTDYTPASNIQVRNMAVFANSAPDAFTPPNPALPATSQKSTAERLQSLYETLTAVDKLNCSKVDPSTFIENCTAALSETSPLNDESAAKILMIAPFAAVFSLKSTSLSPSAKLENLPSGPVFGQCYPFCREGDVLAAFYGCSRLAVLRHDPLDKGKFKVMCEAYVHGFMNGEGVGMFEEREFELT
ncbi:hypothetical protein ONS95_014052 [Cadophora gregata]|uniref:uncharacterized protein n=1 Tax=Cadophora gregata TaxID=51156 RepID=UPI0026DB26C4|nr:uncharacterized protein ONS95_014052 [Cadophora gregata]KAK0113803.1 hypothetical protein ONS96_014657 [Cadophora gregata f. sp. sojae]KAK0114564.1 hypothetical protein ONS95_014052 [Cadophora gregata]